MRAIIDTICRLLLLLSLATTIFALPQDVPIAGEQLSRRDLPIGTCNAQTPCPNGACCGSNGLCGYSPAECGSGCTSNCNAKAACGQYGAPGSQNCPLNVCCSQFGFCGSTSDFCDTGCQKGYGTCGDAPRPSCSGSQVGKRTIGYYESWSATRKCSSVEPEDLNLSGFTHINFAFAFFDPNSFEIVPMDPNSWKLLSRFTALKEKYNGLQTWVSVGGWSFTDPGPTREAFSTMTSTSSNRAKFIQALVKFMNQYGFDGIDLDWEYPQADDRGGQTADLANYVQLAKEIKNGIGSKGLSMTLPTSFWYLQHFDVNSLQEYVDWFNFMSYDLHGTWDAASKFVGPFVAPHTNLTEIDMGLDLLWRAGVRPDKIVLGLAWYGRSFTLKDPSCNTPNGVCQFSGGANAGPCSDTIGILDYGEISDVVIKNNLNPIWDKDAAVKWITWDSNQWVSYDDQDTFQQKKDFASKRCLGGLMIWAMDQMNQAQSNGLGQAPGVTADQQADAQQMSADQAAKLSCYTTDCNSQCKSGTNKVAEVFGQPGQVSTRDRCPQGQYRSVCCTDGTTMGKCAWRGYRGMGMSCIQGCASGETEVVTDTSVMNNDKAQTCNGGLQSYCCSGFKAPPSKNDLNGQVADAAKDTAESAAEQLALDVAAKAFCRVAVPALLAPLELAEDVIPIIGEILDIAEIAATPALIKACVKGVEKEGKAEFKVFGKKHTLSFDGQKTTAKSRPPSSSHSKESTSSECSKRAGCRNLRTITEFSTNHPITTLHPGIEPRYCDGHDYPQACLHYESVIQWHGFGRDPPERGYNPLSCPTVSLPNSRLGDQIVDEWTRQHADSWWHGYMQGSNLNCERDEYPPIAFWQDQDPNEQYIRMVPKAQNRGAGQLFGLGFCSWVYSDGVGHLPSTTSNRHLHAKRTVANRVTETYTGDVAIRQATVSIRFVNMPNLPDSGLTANPCWPSTLVDDPGFALLTDDPWYFDHPQRQMYTREYAVAPPFAVTAGKPPKPGYQRARRDSPVLYPRLEDMVADTGNNTRQLTDEELWERGIWKCGTPNCRDEEAALAKEGVDVVRPVGSPADMTVDANPTPVVSEAGTTRDTMPASVGSGADSLLEKPAKATGASS
ncbi:glycosyl hydrolases family 18-domain-containing protein [Xylaria intraflava]|nr:glycosyl hydrolases family 18-domain-containing protein [Xylaria intraflava]